MQQAFILFLLSISTWRICSLLQDEPGPFHIFERIRTWAGLTRVDDLPLNEQLMYPDKQFIHEGNFFAELIECVMCLSIWVSGAISLYLGLTKIIRKPLIPLYTLTASALTIWLENRRTFDGK